MTEQTIEMLNNDDDITAMLGGLEELESLGADEAMDAGPVEDVLDEVDARSDEASEEVLGDALRDLEIEEAKADAYADQDAIASALGTDDMNTELPEPAATVKPAEKKERKPRVSTEGKKKSEVIMANLGASSAEFFALEMDDAELDIDDLRAKEKEVLAVVDGLPKKVGEKATNLFGFLKTGEHLSVYTKIAFDLLIDKGTFTSEELRNQMLAAGYTNGTSNSQAQQMMQLMPALKIATRIKNIVTRNDESLILAKYESAKATPAPAAE